MCTNLNNIYKHQPAAQFEISFDISHIVHVEAKSSMNADNDKEINNVEITNIIQPTMLDFCMDINVSVLEVVCRDKLLTFKSDQ